MKETNWKDLAELVGIAAIVAPLIFVGLQMQQTRDIAVSERCDFALPFHEKQIEGWACRKSFLKIVEQVISEAKSDPMHCWNQQ